MILASIALLTTSSALAVSATPEMAGNIDLTKARRFFAQFDSLCTRDAGKLWGASFCGPILLVDPVTRTAVTNQPDKESQLQPRGGVFVAKLPDEVPVANTAVEWGGTRWTMIMWWSMGGGRLARSALMLHEAFHRLQPQLNLAAPGELNAHLDTAEARYLMQMEWNALQKALAPSTDARRDAIADALTFRAARRSRFPEAAAREIPLEIHEGLAEYSGLKLAGATEQQVVQAALDKRAQETGFVRSFAYVSGPLYGFLLDGTGADWRKRVTRETDLGALLADLAKVSPKPLQDVDRLAEPYGGVALRAAETEREKKRTEQLNAWRASLIDGPVLLLDLKSTTSSTFDPGRVFPFAENQTVYTTRTLVADWGKLTLENAAILEDDRTMQGRLPLAGAASDHSKGNGWTLALNEGWQIAPAERPGDFVVRKK